MLISVCRGKKKRKKAMIKELLSQSRHQPRPRLQHAQAFYKLFMSTPLKPGGGERFTFRQSMRSWCSVSGVGGKITPTHHNYSLHLWHAQGQRKQWDGAVEEWPQGISHWIASIGPAMSSSSQYWPVWGWHQVSKRHGGYCFIYEC